MGENALNQENLKNSRNAKKVSPKPHNNSSIVELSDSDEKMSPKPNSRADSDEATEENGKDASSSENEEEMDFLEQGAHYRVQNGAENSSENSGDENMETEIGSDDELIVKKKSKEAKKLVPKPKRSEKAKEVIDLESSPDPLENDSEASVSDEPVKTKKKRDKLLETSKIISSDEEFINNLKKQGRRKGSSRF